ncbi:MAG: preprotein translocase subunit YajC [Chitinophagaceae bacterium]
MTNYLFLQAAEGQSSSGFGSMGTLLFFGLFFLIFWFFIIRPQSKKAKEQKKFIANLDKGANIVTIGGLHGTINKVNEDNSTLMLDLGHGILIKVERSAISMDATVALQKANTIVPK